MATMPDSKPSFYKILFDLPPKLGLPQGFMEKYVEMLSEKAELRNGCGNTWKVRVEKLEEDDCYFFTRGWAKFCQDMGLQIYELLLFSYAGNSTFDVSVYATTAMEKEYVNPRFHVVLKKYHDYKFHVPSHFAKSCGLTGNMKMWFEYPGGKSVHVQLNSSKGRVAFCGGWRRFWKENRLTLNKPYFFEFVRTKNVIRVQPDIDMI